MGKAATFLIACFFVSSTVSAQDDYIEISAWEPEDISLPAARFFSRPGLGRLITDRMIQFYQKKIGPNSISRCPFHISCSNYARQAIEKYGLILGVSVFIDRYFYRENSSSFWHYGLRESKDGVLKLDDSFFLYPETDKPHLQTPGYQQLSTSIVGPPENSRQYSRLCIVQFSPTK